MLNKANIKEKLPELTSAFLFYKFKNILTLKKKKKP
jgi:hypothetical protein